MYNYIADRVLHSLSWGKAARVRRWKKVKITQKTPIRSKNSRRRGKRIKSVETLSRLPSTQDAIRTGTLSKRWAHLWTYVPTLIFTRQSLENPNSMSDFALSLDKTLTQCRQLKLKKFELDTVYDIEFESQFNEWIRHAISCKAEELYLDFRYPGREADFPLHQSMFFINSYFTDLRLKGCTLNPTTEIIWKNLRSLSISYMYLHEDLIVNILSGSPLLENLSLEYYYGYGDSNSESEFYPPYNLSLTECPLLNLKKFEVHSIYDIKFNSSLNSWIRYAIRCNIKNICLSFWSSRGYLPEFTLDQIIFTSSCFTELRLDGCKVNPIREIIWKNLRSLCISFGLLNDKIIENILSGSPVLETLELENCFGYKRLDIISKSVKNLVLSGYMNYHDKSPNGVIEINAPNILSLTIQHEMILRKFLMVNVSCLVKAKLNYTCKSEWYCRGDV